MTGITDRATVDHHQTNVMAPVEIGPVTPVEGEALTARAADYVRAGDYRMAYLTMCDAYGKLAASPATPAGSVREECAAACDRIANDSLFVGDNEEGRVRHEGIIAGARNCAAAIRALHPVDSRAQGGEK